jgi:hypothetical protein
MRRELDGQGGAYKHQLDAALGRFARVNANLSFEFDTLSDAGNYETDESGSGFSFSLNSRPRKLQFQHNASGGDFGGVISTVLSTEESLGSFLLTFHDVSYSDNQNELKLGVSDTQPSTNLTGNGNSILYSSQGNTHSLISTDNGSTSDQSLISNIDFSKNVDISIAYDSEVAECRVNGVTRASLSVSNTANFRPAIQLRDSGNAVDTVTVQQITVEPTGGTF